MRFDHTAIFSRLAAHLSDQVPGRRHFNREAQVLRICGRELAINRDRLQKGGLGFFWFSQPLLDRADPLQRGGRLHVEIGPVFRSEFVEEVQQ